jgi:hypothetical protein
MESFKNLLGKLSINQSLWPVFPSITFLQEGSAWAAAFVLILIIGIPYVFRVLFLKSLKGAGRFKRISFNGKGVEIEFFESENEASKESDDKKEK